MTDFLKSHIALDRVIREQLKTEANKENSISLKRKNDSSTEIQTQEKKVCFAF